MASPIAPFAAFAGNVAANSGMQLLGGAQRAITYAANQLVPNAPLDWQQYLILYQMGFISPQAFSNHSKELGLNHDAIEPHQFRMFRPGPDGKLIFNDSLVSIPSSSVERAAFLMKNLPSPEEILLLLNRELIDNQLAFMLLKLSFSGEGALAGKYLTLKDQIPGPSDLIAFAVRDCFSPDIVKTFEYSKELPVEILPWMKKQGLGGDTGLAMPEGSTTTEGQETRAKASWFDLYWWSHWQLPSVGQGYEMLQRLYPDSKHGPSPNATPDTAFSVANLELLQKANDFPTFWRKRLQAIAYHPLGRIDIKRLYAAGVLKEDENKHEVFHAYRALGYDDTNAERLTAFVVGSALKDIQNLTVQQIDKFFLQGTINVAQAIVNLTALGFTRVNATFHVNNLELVAKHQEIDEHLKVLRRVYMQGDYTLDQLVAELNLMGLEYEAAQRYIRMWTIQRNGVIRHISVEKTIDAYKKGIIPEVSVRLRMTNLSYDLESQETMIRIAKYDIAVAQQKNLDKLSKGIAKQTETAAKEAAKRVTEQTKAGEKAAKTTTKEVEKTHKEVLAAYSDKNMIAWLKKGLITRAFADAILVQKGYDPIARKAWLDTNAPVAVGG